MRGNKRAVCLLLAALLALGCLGMAGCKEPEPHTCYIGDIEINDIPGNWILSDTVNQKYQYVTRFKIDEETEFSAGCNKRYELPEDYYESLRGDVMPKPDRLELVDKREIAGREALHFMIYWEPSVNGRRTEEWVLKCDGGVAVLMIKRTSKSEYVTGEEFEQILDNARALETTFHSK